MKNVNEFGDLFREMLDRGYIKVQTHPEFDLRIYNYTPKAQYENLWNEVTTNCRGLITDAQGEILARGMPKFFNHGQPGAPEFDLEDRVSVSDKLDGSLGIIYRLPTGDFAVATRGSFTSEQALHATQLLNSSDDALYLVRGESATGYTPLVEIIYPENRIVLDYGGLDGVPFLGSVNKGNGEFVPADPRLDAPWPWGLATNLGAMTYAEALAMPPRENAEGLVLSRLSDGAMVKVKQEDYLALHRVIFGISARAIWQLHIDGEDVNKWIINLPDEFVPWAKNVYRGLEEEVEARMGQYHEEWNSAVSYLDSMYGIEGWDQKEFAMHVKDWDSSWAMFRLEKGQDIEAQVWKRCKPEGNLTPITDHGEDVA